MACAFRPEPVYWFQSSSIEGSRPGDRNAISLRLCCLHMQSLSALPTLKCGIPLQSIINISTYFPMLGNRCYQTNARRDRCWQQAQPYLHLLLIKTTSLIRFGESDDSFRKVCFFLCHPRPHRATCRSQRRRNPPRTWSIRLPDKNRPAYRQWRRPARDRSTSLVIDAGLHRQRIGKSPFKSKSGFWSAVNTGGNMEIVD